MRSANLALRQIAPDAPVGRVSPHWLTLFTPRVERRFACLVVNAGRRDKGKAALGQWLRKRSPWDRIHPLHTKRLVVRGERAGPVVDAVYGHRGLASLLGA